VAEIRHFTARSYESVVEGDIEACFDEISDRGLMDRVRRRIGDKRVLANVESTLIAPAIFSGRSASRFAGCIGRLSDANALASTSPAVPPVTPAR